MKFLKEYISLSERETDEIAGELKDLFSPGAVVELVGNLGSGKTYFVKSFCKHLGIANAGSPSFAIVNEYEGNIKVIHFDFYRIKKIEELYDIGFHEYLNNEQAIIFVEWGELFESILPLRRYQVNIIIKTDNKRIIKLYKYE